MPETGSKGPMEVVFYGVRGSLPAPPTPAMVQEQIARALYQAGRAGVRFESVEDASDWLTQNLAFCDRSSYGGDTTSCLVRCGETLIVIDAGSGIRRLGQDLMPELFDTGSLKVNVLFTHMHLDHILGFPFFGPLFAPKTQYNVALNMYGGGGWKSDLETVLSATVGAPLFPVELDKLRYEGASIDFNPVYDGSLFTVGDKDPVTIFARRLHHPNETYGYRIEYRGRVFVMATDTEPYAGPDRVLEQLAHDADVVYVDSQYDWDQYCGTYDGIARLGWGHGYAEWCGRYAREAGVKMAVMGHHDPSADNRRIAEIGDKMRAEFPGTVVGFDGLRVTVQDDMVVAAGAGRGGEDVCIPRRRARVAA